ncbi:MAG: alkaline phosphatase family protein [Actinomycetota bacterium]|nr:alkaline phosphatase family protein [Actinomycetota bacterium]
MRFDLSTVARHVEAALARRRTARHGHSSWPSPFPDRPVGTDTMPEIRHIVVLMMENHSYDNYLGMLDRGDGLARDQEGRPTATNPDHRGDPVTSHRLPSTEQFPQVPSQAWEASHEQWADGRNDGFVRSAQNQQQPVDPGVAMGYWTEKDLPFYYALARTFPLADRWFCSCLGPTFPNRRFLISGTAHGLTSDKLSRTIDRPAHGTIFDLLDKHRITWVNYHPVSHARPVGRRLAGAHGLRAGRVVSGMVKPWATKVGTVATNAKSRLEFTADCYPLGLVRYVRHVRSVDRFVADASAGVLPSVSIVDPDFHYNSEENPQDIRLGEAFAARIVNAVMHGPGWSGTVLIWVHDEHGGYYDHVPPPQAPEPDDRHPEDAGSTRYDRYGFRVPAVIVAPFARSDYVSHEIHDHTSILKLIETKWNLPPLTRRDAQADNLLDSLDLSGPPAFAKPPDLAGPALRT